MTTVTASEARRGLYEKLVGDRHGASGRRSNLEHLLVYEVVHVLRMWTHYE